MNEREREIDRAIAKARRREFFRVLGESRLAIVLGIGLLGVIGFGAAFSAAPLKLEATVIGHTMNEATARASRSGQQTRLEVVRLDNGAVVDVNMTADRPVPAGTAIKVEVYEKDFGPLHQMSYRFAGYADATPAS